MGALTSAELALVTNDKPMLVGGHVIATAAPTGTDIKWLAGDNLSGADLTPADFPAKRIYDKYQHLPTKPNTGGIEFNLSMDLGAAYEFDMIMIGGHNFGTEGSLTVKFEKGTDATFSSTTTLSTWTPGSSDKRLVSLVLDTGGDGTALRWTERYLRVNITGSTFTPSIGEIWVGRRRHLPYKFNVAGQNKRTRSEIQTFESRSGITTRYILSQGRAIREGSIEMDSSTHINDVAEWWKETSYGSKPFLWIEDPGTSPQNCHVMTCEPELSFDSTGPSSRMLDLAMVESAPYLSGET